MSKVGRPPKNPEERLDQSIRTLVSGRVKQYFIEKAIEEDLTEAQLLRLALYNLMRPWSGAPLDDPTFNDIEK
jgi:predicted DNA-binding protein